MKTDDVSLQLRDFAVNLIDQVGGEIEWAADSDSGLAVVPEDVAHAFLQADEAFSISTQSGQSGLVLGLGNEFVDLAADVLHRYVPAAGSFRMLDLPVKKTDYQSAVDAAFGWQNARVRVKDGHIDVVPYHTWWFHVTLQSDETWDSVIRTSLNAKSLTLVDLGDPLEWLTRCESSIPICDSQLTIETASRIAEQKSMKEAAGYLDRVDQRLERDRKRLTDYYAALRRDASVSNRRTKTAPSPEEVEAKQRAITLELKRKLSELDERFQLVGTIRPIAMIECSIPSVAISVEIQRKTAVRNLTVVWNGLLRRIEPLKCTLCEQGCFNVWFSNDDVLPYCGSCRNSSS